MILAFFASAAVLAFLGPLTAGVWRRLDPPSWVWVGAFVAIISALLFEASLVSVAIPTVFHAVGMTALGDTCRRMLGGLTAGDTPIGWLALVISLGVPIRVIFRVRKMRRILTAARVDPGFGEQKDQNGYVLVVLPVMEPIAVSVAGYRPQIVVSKGLVESLDRESFAAILAHEEAHLAHRHQGWLIVIAGLEGGLPFLRWSTALLRLGLERWADEVAAVKVGRQAVRNALLDFIGMQLALGEQLPAFGVAGTLIQRVEAMEELPGHPRRLLRLWVRVVPGTFGFVGFGVLAWWANFVYLALSVPRICPF